MGVEAPGYISDLNPAWPVGNEPVDQGDNHLRLIKQTLQLQFPALDAAVNMTPDEMNACLGGTGADPFQAQLDALAAQLASIFSVGDIKLSGTSPGTSWLACDGAAYNTSTEATLFAAIGYAFGGSGVTFNVPDMKGRAPVGVGLSAGTGFPSTWNLGSKAGAENVALTVAQMPAHNHNAAGTWYWGTAETTIQPGGGTRVPINSLGRGIVTEGSGAAHSNIQPSTGLNFYIKRV